MSHTHTRHIPTTPNTHAHTHRAHPQFTPPPILPDRLHHKLVAPYLNLSLRRPSSTALPACVAVGLGWSVCADHLFCDSRRLARCCCLHPHRSSAPRHMHAYAQVKTLSSDSGATWHATAWPVLRWWRICIRTAAIPYRTVTVSLSWSHDGSFHGLKKDRMPTRCCI